MTAVAAVWLLASGILIADWPGFRGGSLHGVGTGTPPTTWDLAAGTNVAWRAPVPGLGHSSPIVAGDTVFVTTAVPVGGAESSLRVGRAGVAMATDLVAHEWRLYALDRATGRVRWQQVRVSEVPNGFAASPVAANGRIYLVSEDGDVFVVKAGRTHELEATNKLNEISLATPAVDGNLMLIRTRGQLIALGKP